MHSPISKRKRRLSQCDSQENKEQLKRHKSDSELITRQQTKPLIGDFSRECALQTVPGKEHDIAYISPATMVELLNKDQQNVTIIDCRYDYEYDGGHIVGAKNCSTQDMLRAELLSAQQRASHQNHIVIFHCEFSQERGPKMLRHLRQQDRTLNAQRYPSLFYPEVYLLQGGYKAFWDHCTLIKSVNLCEPQAYKPMLASSFQKMPLSSLQPAAPTTARSKRKFKRALLFEE